MSALGQKQTSPNVRGMSALPPKADIHCGQSDVRFVPEADLKCRKRPSRHGWIQKRKAASIGGLNQRAKIKIRYYM
jgi:hypothetical protein